MNATVIFLCAAHDAQRFLHVQKGHGIRRILKVRNLIVGGPPGNRLMLGKSRTDLVNSILTP